MTAKAQIQTTLSCDVEDCPHHLTLAGDIPVARERASGFGWSSKHPNDWCAAHPDAGDDRV